MASNSNTNPFLMQGGGNKFKDLAKVLIVGMNHHKQMKPQTCLSTKIALH